MGMIEISRFSAEHPRFLAILQRGVADDTGTLQAASTIVDDVRKNGDEALFHYMKKFDGIDYAGRSPRLTASDLDLALKGVDKGFLAVVDCACRNLRTYHEKQLPKDYAVVQEDGGQLKRRYFPIDSVGVCVPAAAAPLPSTLIMCVVPALVAGVRRIVVISAPREGRVHPEIVAVAAHLGISEIYGVSGAQGVASLAYGTASILKVDKIVGPGNKWVMMAKKLVYGAVGIDSLAGPSEVVIFADDTANPEFVAVDLLAQAEHGTGYEAAVAFVKSEKMAHQVETALERLVTEHGLEKSVGASLTRFGNIFIVDDFNAAIQACETIAPEHVEVQCENSEELVGKLRRFGAAFSGSWTPEAVGDYYAGCNHVLPTQGTARFSSGLTVNDFMRSSAVVNYSKETLERNCERITMLAQREGLKAHGLSVALRCRPRLS